MNKRIETVLNNKKAKSADYFELVNIFELSSLSLQNDKHRIVSMDVNEFRKTHDGFEFRQKCTDTHFSIKEDDIQSVSGRMLDETDTFLVTVNLTDGTNVYISIFRVYTNVKTEEQENYKEMDVLSLKEYFDDESHLPRVFSIDDSFGFTTRIDRIVDLSFVEEEEEFRYKLHISNGCGADIEFPLVDDSCNEIYLKESGFADTILIRPYGQPFMEIKIIVLRR